MSVPAIKDISTLQAETAKRVKLRKKKFHKTLI